MSKLREILPHGTLQPDSEGQVLSLICVRAGETLSLKATVDGFRVSKRHMFMLNFSLQAQSPPPLILKRGSTADPGHVGFKEVPNEFLG